MPDHTVPTGQSTGLAVFALVTTTTPVALYFLTRPYVPTDTVALAIAAAVPAG